MADFRCANPAYQLDVDTMVIEYTLYHAVDAKLKAAKAGILQKNDLKVKSETAERLIQSFDTFLRLFKHHHPTAAISEGTTFNIKVLEFLVLFSLWIYDAPCSDQLLRERTFNSRFRQCWLESWNSDLARLDDNGSQMELDSDISPSVNLDDIVLRFMDLSAEISHSMGSVTEQWYRLAAESMLQCALDGINDFVNHKEHHQSQQASDRQMRDLVIERFAWGSTTMTLASASSRFNNDAWTRERIAEQFFICDMFKPGHQPPTANSSSSSNSTPNTKTPTANNEVEDATWTQIRNLYLNEALSVLPRDNETLQSQTESLSLLQARLQRVQDSHPQQNFRLGLCEFVEGLWCLNMDSISGKPALVQIEEGGMKGMNQTEFSEFLGRVGLKVSGGAGAGASGKAGLKWLR